MSKQRDADVVGNFGEDKMKRDQTFRLIGESCEGGYTYVTSPDLPGFTFMLEPNEEDLQTVIEAMQPALEAFIKARDAEGA
jgi:hypothetical protein